MLSGLLAFAAATFIAGGPVFGAKEKVDEKADEKIEKPQKESKDVQTAKKMHVMFTQQMGVHGNLIRRCPARR